MMESKASSTKTNCCRIQVEEDGVKLCALLKQNSTSSSDLVQMMMIIIPIQSAIIPARQTIQAASFDLEAGITPWKYQWPGLQTELLITQQAGPSWSSHQWRSYQFGLPIGGEGIITQQF